MSDNEFSKGVVAMARNTSAAITLVREGHWALDDVDRWLQAVIDGDLKFLNQPTDHGISPIGQIETKT